MTVIRTRQSRAILARKQRWIHEVAVIRHGADLFAAGDAEGRVTIWSFQQRRTLNELNTIFGFGGSRLALVYRTESAIVVAASYDRGVAAYDVLSGTMLWHRKDLKHIQQVTDLTERNTLSIGIGTDTNYQIVDAVTGESVGGLPGVTRVYASSFSPFYFAVSNNKAHLTRLESGPIWSKQLVSFAVLHASLSPEQVAYSEAGGSVFCYDFDGTQLWEFSPAARRHVLCVGWHAKSNTWLAIDWNYYSGGPKRLFKIDSKGKDSTIAQLGRCAEAAFFHGAEYVVSSNGKVTSTDTGECAWQFATASQ